MTEKPNIVNKTFLTDDAPAPVTYRPVQLQPGRTHQVVAESRCIEVKPVLRENVTELKFVYENGTVLYVPVAEDASYSYTLGALTS